ncbi:acyl-protein synthetase [Bacillus salitolerans]|uniref:Acyl-protein synthetase n=1 Tax=Bacillus salitolerans TaxID=1437434 RepID=A0ABW4LNL9_9BACI
MDINFGNPYALSKKEKQEYLLNRLTALTIHHRLECVPYVNMLNNLSFTNEPISIKDLPYLPVQLFKMLELKSVPDSKVIKTLTSSGTTSQKVSKIYLDKETSILQTKALVSIVTSFIGKKRLPMLIIDTKEVLKNRTSFSARGAGILGFSNFGRNPIYALDEKMNLDINEVVKFIEENKRVPKLLFGFTYMIWEYFFKYCKENNIHLDLKDSLLIHGGGWKKLSDEAVDNMEFKLSLEGMFNLSKIHNYYGMVEQVGSIFMECEHGYFHTPDFADIIIRDPLTLEVLPVGRTGVIQVLSTLPQSYPGHSLLTEDLGMIRGEDNCSCGRFGKYFHVFGRIPKAELRGCSDTHAFDRLGGVEF